MYLTKSNKSNDRVEFIPVDWQRLLTFGRDTSDLITPAINRDLKIFVNLSMFNIIHYTNPVFHHKMTSLLKLELHRLYFLFCQNNDYFVKNKGKVSVIAHSLGGVLIHDVLNDWTSEQVLEERKTSGMVNSYHL